MTEHSEKLQKILAAYNLGSRRKMEEVISAGRVTVNGKVAKLGDRATMEDRIQVDNRAVGNQGVRMTRPRVVIYHKPVGEVCTAKDPEGRKTVFDALERMNKGRWIMVGRLDINTSGLLLFTTDGELANRLMHPSYNVEREYAVRVFGEVTDEIMDKLKQGVVLDDGPAKFDRIQFVGGEQKNSWYHVTLSEGRNREVRRIFESVGLQVSRLTRVRYGSIILPKFVSRGKTYELDPMQVNALRDAVGMKRFFFPKKIYDKSSK